MDPQIKTGSVVQLKSGGPNMTVLSVDRDNASCVWFAEFQRHVVLGEGITKEQADELREQVDKSLANPNYAVVTNFQVAWNEVGGSPRVDSRSFPLDALDLVPTEPATTPDNPAEAPA